MRPLTLHASALSDAEYDLYTSSLRDLAPGDDDVDYDNDDGPGSATAGGRGKGTLGNQNSHDSGDVYLEKLSVGVREVRAWLRGRYAHVPAPVIDGILRLFSPTLTVGAVLSGSEFFAVLRLVMHAQSGKTIERSLAFIQADLSSPIATPSGVRVGAHSAPSSQAPSPSKRLAELPAHQPPPMPSRRPTHGEPTRSNQLKGDLNPFTATSSSAHEAAQPPPLHPSQRSEPARSIAGSHHSQSHSSHNPFVQGSVHASSSSTSQKIPPLPPRKVAPLIPTSSASGSNMAPAPLIAPPPPPRSLSLRRAPDRLRERSTSPAKKPPPPPPPYIYPQINTYASPAPALTTPFAPAPQPKPTLAAPQHVTSTLMKQSLHASKVAQTMKRAEEMLEKERVMQVLKRSGAPSAPQSHTQHRQDSHNPQQHPFPGSSASSLQPPQQGTRTESPQRWETGSTSASSASAHSPSLSASANVGASSAPPLPRRRAHTSGQPSPPLSASSWEQVARAGAGFSASTDRRQRETTWTPDRSGARDWGVNADVDRSTARHRDGSASPARAPPTHPDRKPYLHGVLGTSSSNSAFDAVYGDMGMPPSSGSSPVRGTFSPGGGSGNSSPTARVFRSKSLHYNASSASPSPFAAAEAAEETGGQQGLGQGPPPVRRRRPESVQVLSGAGGGVGSLVSHWNAHASKGGGAGGGGMSVHRRSSLSAAPSRSASYEFDNEYVSPFAGVPMERSSDQPVVSPGPPQARTTATEATSTSSETGAGNHAVQHHHSQSFPQSSVAHLHTQSNSQSPRPLASLQRTFAALQPRIDAALYKAEAGIAGRRGFIPSGTSSGNGEGEDVGLMGGSRHAQPHRAHTHQSPSRSRSNHRAHRSVYGSDDEAPGVDPDADFALRTETESSPERAPSPSPYPSPGPSEGGADGAGDKDDEAAWQKSARRVGGDRLGAIEKDSLKWPAGEGWHPL